MSETTHPKLLALPEVMAMTSLARSTVYDAIRAGRFPQPVKIGQVRRWRASDIEAWMNALEPASIGGGR